MAKDRSRYRDRLLRPLVRRLTEGSTAAELRRALEALELRAVVDDLIPELAAEMRSVLGARTPATGGDPGLARTKIRLAAALYLGRRISFAQYVFTVAHAVDHVHETRSSDEKELKDLSAAMTRVEMAHGLADTEFWSIGDAPEEYRRLNTLWEEAYARQRQEAFDELEGREAAALLQRDPEEFSRVSERGRRAYFHRSDLVPALVDTIIRYEHEAARSASAGAYTASITLIGAALEGMLLLRCLKSPRKVSRVVAAFPSKAKPRYPESPETWALDHLIKVCHAAGWLPQINTKNLIVQPEGLAHRLKEIRNYVHPGRVSKERPWVAAESRDYEDALGFYKALHARVFRGALLTALADAEQLGSPEPPLG
jgi:hypothetical protein